MQVVIVKKDLPVKSMAELVAYAKANPGKLNYGSSGAGGLTHYSVELFQARTGTRWCTFPFKGGAPSTAAVVAGDVDFSFANMTDASAADRGRHGARPCRHLAASAAPTSRICRPCTRPSLPDFMVETWNGIMAPAEDTANRSSASCRKF